MDDKSNGPAWILGSFPFVPPCFVGAYYLHLPNARAIFLQNDLLCNSTRSVTGVRIMHGGTQTKKIQILFQLDKKTCSFLFLV